MKKANITKTLLLAALVAATAVSCSKDNSSGTGGGSGTADTDKAPAVPSGIAVSGTAGTQSLSFSWNEVKGAESYGWKLLQGLTLTGSGSTATNSVTVSDLKEKTTYKFAVKAVSQSGESDFSSYLEATTAASVSPDPEPEPGPDPVEDVYAAMNIPADEDADGIVRAFPGADGGAMQATGGRGGAVLHVTSLKDDGSEGTLRWAVSKSGPRTVVFDVAGTIQLKSRLEIKNGDITIAGQTAPGDGICLRDNTVRINASNVVLRYLRLRMGDETATEDDALNCYTHDNPGFSHVIVDHCSLSWCTDECGSFYGIDGLTVQYCILSESLRLSVHDKGSHGYGGLWGGANASYHHNLLAHHDSRNPRFSHDYLNTEKGPIHFYNNVVYNWGANSAYGGEGGKAQSPRQINFVNNYYKPGPATSRTTRLLNPTTKCSNCNSSDKTDVTPGLFWVSGNYMYGSEKVTADNWEGVEPDDASLKESLKASSYMGTQPARMHNAEQAFESVLGYSGACLRRDKTDERIVRETREGSYTYTGSKGGTKGLIDSQNDVGGWCKYTATEEEIRRAATDTDADGIPDWYEDLLGLDKSNAADAALFTIDSKLKRYNNLEMYLQYLVRDITANQYK